MMTALLPPKPPYTQAVRRALQGISDSRMEADLLFLEAWEIHPSPHLGVTLRASQIRRANPALAAEIDAELKAGPKGVQPNMQSVDPQRVAAAS
jgi:hypothetical protein